FPGEPSVAARTRSCFLKQRSGIGTRADRDGVSGLSFVESGYAMPVLLSSLVETAPSLLDVHASAKGPAGSLPLTEELLRHAPSGDLFGWSQNVGMGWRPDE